MVPSIVVCVSVCGIDCVVRTESSSVSAGLGWGWEDIRWWGRQAVDPDLVQSPAEPSGQLISA